MSLNKDTRAQCIPKAPLWMYNIIVISIATYGSDLCKKGTAGVCENNNRELVPCVHAQLQLGSNLGAYSTSSCT